MLKGEHLPVSDYVHSGACVFQGPPVIGCIDSSFPDWSSLPYSLSEPPQQATTTMFHHKVGIIQIISSGWYLPDKVLSDFCKCHLSNSEWAAACLLQKSDCHLGALPQRPA